MVPRRSSIGWWLLAAASLVWLGCNQVEPRSPAYKPPVPAPLLQIAESSRPPATLPRTPAQSTMQSPAPTLPQTTVKLGDPVTPKSGGHASLLPPLTDQPLPLAPTKPGDPAAVPL